MQRVIGSAAAFVASSRAMILAALSFAAPFPVRARQAVPIRWAEISPRLVRCARSLRDRAIRLQTPAVRLIAASAALVLTLAALALPSGNSGKVLAPVELALGTGSGGAVGRSADESPIDTPMQALASSTSVARTPPRHGSAPTQHDAPESQTGEPSLSGLAEIPEDLIARPSKDETGERPRGPSFAAPSETRENLPWKAVEPVMFTPMGPGEQRKPGEAPAKAAAPAPAEIAGADIGKWMKGKATKIMGAARTKPLYHFVVWVEPPEAMQARVAGVSYDFSSPAVQPQSHSSMDRESGFKINAAGLACADEITVTLRFEDGRIEKTNIDGCELFNKA